MSRARAQNNKAAATLFPFLAVLLSTMGVLVVLLVAMASVQVDQAKKKQEEDADRHRQASDAPEQQRLRKELAHFQGEIAQLDSMRLEERNALRDAQLRTSHIEENIRRWQDRLDSLRFAISELTQLNGDHTDDREQAKQRLADLQEKIVAAQSQVADLKEAAAEKPEAYAILPYDGPNGTKRRPIYIECLRDRVVIQPEGIELFAADFHPGLGAGNPLAAALRAAREYYQAEGRSSYEEAYPLILVRPEGIGSYRAVLEAIHSWDSPFGYEMVGEDWELDYGAANPEVTLEIATAVDNSRRRQAKLATAAPATFAGGSQDAFQTQSGLLETVRSGAPLGGGFTATGAGGNRGGQRSGNVGHGSGAPTPDDRLAAALKVATGSERGAGAAGVAGEENFSESQQAGLGVGSQGLAMEEGEGSQGPHDGDSESRKERTGTESEADQPSDALAQVGVGNAGGTSPPSRANASGDASSQASGQSGQGSAAANASASNASGGESSSGTGNQSSSPGNGLGVQRPIQVVVRPDRLIVLQDSVRPSVEAIHGRTVLLEKKGGRASEQFSVAIREHIEDWGIAGAGSYWKPVLVLNVAPGGEKLAQELSIALRASGIEVRFPSTTRR